jgi:two-component system response regulator YesN
MLKLLIVDDEIITRETLRDFIPWRDFGIEAIETANNGVTALAVAKDFQPDIILCDVRMPKMDGIELAENIKRSNPQCKIIFLSGYSDKEYLKSAIALQAINYLEKPINFGEVKEVVAHTVELCNFEIQEKAEKKKLEDNAYENIALTKQRLVLEIARQKSASEDIRQKYDFPFIKLFDQGAFFVMYILLKKNTVNGAKPAEKAAASLHGLVYDQVFGCSDTALAAFDEGGSIILIAHDPDPVPGSTDQKERLAENVFNQVSAASGGCFDIFVGVGLTVDSFENIGNSYTTAVNATESRFYEGPNRIHEADGQQYSRFNADSNLEVQFRELLKQGAFDEASNLTQRLAEQAQSCKDSDISHVKNIFFNLLITLYNMTKEAGFPEEAQEDDRKYIWQKVEKAELLSGLVDTVLASIRDTAAYFDDKNMWSAMALVPRSLLLYCSLIYAMISRAFLFNLFLSSK